MKKFDYSAPATVDEALKLLNEYRDRAAVLAGGTDLVIALHEREHDTDCIVDISKLSDLRYIEVDDGIVRVGPLSSFTDLENSEYIRGNVRSLYEAAYTLGSPQIRNLGTIGGNLINASVAGDSITAFMALDSTLVFKSESGRREVKLVDYYTDENKIRSDELLTEVYFDAPGENSATTYVKLGKRNALVIVVLGLGLLLERDEENVCTKAQVVIGAVSRFPVRVASIEEYLLGKTISWETFAPCAEMLSEVVQELIPTRASLPYKKESVKGVSNKAFRNILESFGIDSKEEKLV
ncbi:MAG: xanthine dehydrogenase family protein subunit M [Clostridiaceae bacterium]|jgi:carbon-monoxide dehydrogenase medium subunit/xanthine dehydrogenase FAD-binding subunit|nr:xanthine dehydrogenase family protein subunit M [Clostridiaceae bacterium]HZJ90216.1 FAD binding domain-containing protein [Oscillospiraceae bacterium]